MYKDKSEITVTVSKKAIVEEKEVTISKEIRVMCDRDTDFDMARTGLCKIISFIEQIQQKAEEQAEAAKAQESPKQAEEPAKVEAIQ